MWILGVERAGAGKMRIIKRCIKEQFVWCGWAAGCWANTAPWLCSGDMEVHVNTVHTCLVLRPWGLQCPPLFGSVLQGSCFLISRARIEPRPLRRLLRKSLWRSPLDLCSEHVHSLTQVQGQVSEGSALPSEEEMAFQRKSPSFLTLTLSPWQLLIPSEFSQWSGTAEVGCCIISDPLPVLHPSSQRWFVNIIFPLVFESTFSSPLAEGGGYFWHCCCIDFAPCLRLIWKIITAPKQTQFWCLPLNLPVHLKSWNCSFATTWDPKCKLNWRSHGNQLIHFLCDEQRCIKGKLYWNLNLGRK